RGLPVAGKIAHVPTVFDRPAGLPQGARALRAQRPPHEGERPGLDLRAGPGGVGGAAPRTGAVRERAPAPSPNLDDRLAGRMGARELLAWYQLDALANGEHRRIKHPGMVMH